MEPSKLRPRIYLEGMFDERAGIRNGEVIDV